MNRYLVSGFLLLLALVTTNHNFFRKLFRQMGPSGTGPGGFRDRERKDLKNFPILEGVGIPVRGPLVR